MAACGCSIARVSHPTPHTPRFHCGRKCWLAGFTITHNAGKRRVHSAAQVGKRTSALCSRRAAVPRSRCSKTDSNSDCLCPWCRSALQSQGSCCGRTKELLVVGAHQFTVRLTIPAQLRILSLCGLNSTKTAKGLQVPAVPVAEAGFKRCQEGWNAGVHRPLLPLNA